MFIMITLAGIALFATYLCLDERWARKCIANKTARDIKKFDAQLNNILKGESSCPNLN